MLKSNKSNQAKDPSVIDLAKRIEQLIYPKKEKTLDDVCVLILKGLIQGKTYTAIAEEINYDDGYVGDRSRLLFRKLSEALGISITKNNFRWVAQSRLSQVEVN